MEIDWIKVDDKLNNILTPEGSFILYSFDKTDSKLHLGIVGVIQNQNIEYGTMQDKGCGCCANFIYIHYYITPDKLDDKKIIYLYKNLETKIIGEKYEPARND